MAKTLISQSNIQTTIVRAASETDLVVTIENHSIIGGLGGAVAEVLSEHHPVYLKRLGLPDVFGESGDNEAIFAKYGLNIDGIVKVVKQVLEEKKR